MAEILLLGAPAQAQLTLHSEDLKLRGLPVAEHLVILGRRSVQMGSSWQLSAQQEITGVEEDNVLSGLVLVRLSGPSLAFVPLETWTLPRPGELALAPEAASVAEWTWVPGFGFVIRLPAGLTESGPVMGVRGQPAGFAIEETDGSMTIVPLRSVAPVQGPRFRWDEWKDRWPEFPALDDLASFYRIGSLAACQALAPTIPNNESVFLSSLCRARSGDLQSAGQGLGKVVSDNPGEAYAMASLAAIYQQAGYVEQSLGLSRKALLLRQEVPYVNGILASKYLVDENFEDALRHFDSWIENIPAPSEAAFAHFGRGAALLRLGRYSEALSALRHAEQTPEAKISDPLTPSAWQSSALQDPRDLALGRSLAGLSRWKEAIARFEAVFQRSPQLVTAELLVEVGEAYSRLGQWEEARSRFEKAAGLDPDSANAHHWFGVALSWNRDWTGAERELLRAIELSPGDSESHYMLGVTYVNLGSLVKAEAQVLRLKELGSSMAAQLQNLLDSRRPD